MSDIVCGVLREKECNSKKRKKERELRMKSCGYTE